MYSAKFGKPATEYACLSALLLAVILLNGCHGPDKPRMRWGAFFGSPTGMKFPDPANLGAHSFKLDLSETNGMVYTCKGGFVDIGHVREAADRTRYLKGVVYQNLIRKKPEFSFRVLEPSRYRVKISYPPGWDNRSPEEREQMVNEISFHLGQYFAHMSMIWHEILSWHGYATLVIFPDTISAFSWEDSYSDLLGTRLGVQALRDRQRPYDEAVTKLIYEALKELDVQPVEVAHRAAKWVEGQWYKGGLYFLVDMKMHNFDVGFDDGSISPWLVPEICPGAVARLYPVPSLQLLEQYGLKMEIEMEPRVMVKGKIYDSIGLSRDSLLNPQIHFPLLMQHIESQSE